MSWFAWGFTSWFAANPVAVATVAVADDDDAVATDADAKGSLGHMHTSFFCKDNEPCTVDCKKDLSGSGYCTHLREISRDTGTVPAPVPVPVPVAVSDASDATDGECFYQERPVTSESDRPLSWQLMPFKLQLQKGFIQSVKLQANTATPSPRPLVPPRPRRPLRDSGTLGRRSKPPASPRRSKPKA
jgi:hypothetical protein